MQNWKESFYMNLVTGEVVSGLPKIGDIVKEAAWFQKCDEFGVLIEDINEITNY